MRRAELERQKPNANEARPEDLAAICYAEASIGDYKLKSAETYVVPVAQRVNALQKRRQMLLMQESVRTIKAQFNARLLALRDLKRRLIDDVNRDVARVTDLGNLLSDPSDTLNPVAESAGEWPEDRDHVTDADLGRYERDLEQRQVTKQVISAYGGAVAEKTSAEAVPPPAKTTPIVTNENVAAHEQLLNALEKSTLEKRRADWERVRWRHERDTLRARIDVTIAAFDVAVEGLRREKFRLDADLKQTEIKLLTLYQELQLLKSFDDREVM
jgi:hypothetical protein